MRVPHPRATPTLTTVQLLSFNDYHGHLEATDGAAEQEPATRRRRRSAAPSTSSTKLSELRAKVGDADSLTVAAGDLIGGSTFLSGHVPRRALGRVAQRDGPRRQQCGQPRVRRGHRPSSCACRTAAATRSTAATSPTSPTRAPTSSGSPPTSCKKDDRQDPPARHVGQDRQRRQGRLHRDDPRGDPHPGQPRRRGQRRLQGRGADRQRTGRAAQGPGSQGDRRAAARGRLPGQTYQRLRRHLRADRARSRRR